ncbi:MAG TPA: hypothetical protein VLN58_15240 [Verrucomicrobiae bacterium]|nr:hypothetical protein [Verrucomicrobiae bacterium]
MPGRKRLINQTGKELSIALLVRQGEDPDPAKQGKSVEVNLSPDPDSETGEDNSTQIVEYGDNSDIYLNGLELVLTDNGSELVKRVVVLERGSELDNTLNMNSILEFVYDGNSVLVSGRNEPDVTYEFTKICFDKVATIRPA